MEIPVWSEEEYKVKEIKLWYNSTNLKLVDEHKKHLEDNGWVHVRDESMSIDDGFFKIYRKENSLGRCMSNQEYLRIENIDF